MNAEKYTQNALKAVQEAASTSAQYGNPTVDLDHLLDALLREKNDLIPTILESLKVDVSLLKSQIVRNLENKPKVGGGAQPFSKGDGRGAQSGRAGSAGDGRPLYQRGAFDAGHHCRGAGGI